MQSRLAKVGVSVIAVGLALSPLAAFAKTTSPWVNWKTNGPVSFSTDTITLTEKGTETESAYADVAVDVHAGDYAVLGVYTKAEKVRKDDITGLPYVNGYALDSHGKILAYLNGQGMIRPDAKSGAWTVNSGVFKLPAGTATIRYFLKQAEKKGSTKTGEAASFKHPSLFIVSGKKAAERAEDEFAFGLTAAK